MSYDYSFSTQASTALTETIPLDVNVNGVSLTIEFSDKDDFGVVRVSKTVTGVGSSATVSLSAADIDALKGGYHRVKNGSTVIAAGHVS